MLTRRSEKKVLNDINTRTATAPLKFFLPDAKNPAKRKDRVATPREKVFLLVRSLGDLHTTLACTACAACFHCVLVLARARVV